MATKTKDIKDNYSWDDCISKARKIDSHYAMSEADERVIFETIKDLPAGSVFVELGTAHGKTSAIMAYVAKHQGAEYHGVDNFSLEGTEAEVRASLDALELPYTLHVAKTQELPWTTPIDALVIDAGHDEANVKPDCEKWIPLVKPGGYVFFDDWVDIDDRVNNPHWAVPFYGKIATEGWEEVKIPIDNNLARMMVRRKPRGG